ncbi:MAG TPA: hypothetical protein VK304_00880 [Thermoleophilaceae bacterium]|nr:hypothetical protein [Thermoleophilaceae bacterium]
MLDVIGLILIGAVIGVVARLLLPGRQKIGFFLTILMGIGGALIGGLIAGAIGTGDIFELNFLGTVFAVIAAVLLVGAASAMVGGGDRRREPVDRPVR